MLENSYHYANFGKKSTLSSKRWFSGTSIFIIKYVCTKYHSEIYNCVLSRYYLQYRENCTFLYVNKVVLLYALTKIDVFLAFNNYLPEGLLLLSFQQAFSPDTDNWLLIGSVWFLFAVCLQCARTKLVACRLVHYQGFRWKDEPDDVETLSLTRVTMILKQMSM